MYSTNAVLPAIRIALSSHGFKTEADAADKTPEAMAIKRMTYTALRMLTPESSTGAATILGLNAASAKSYEEHLGHEHANPFWRSPQEKNDWIAEVVRAINRPHSQESAKPQAD